MHSSVKEGGNELSSWPLSLALAACEGEKRETSTQNCNETMLHEKLRVFVSRISPPWFGFIYQSPIKNKNGASFFVFFSFY